MIKRRNFTLSPLASAIGQLLLGASAVLFTGPAGALTLVDDEQQIGASTPVDSYRVNDGGRLVAEGATTQQIDVRTGGGLQLEGSTVSATGVAAVMVNGGASATIANGSRLTSNLFGLDVLRSATAGSTVSVTGSHIEGGVGGARVAGSSHLSLTDSTLVSTGAAGAALLFGDARLDATNSQLTSATDGIRVVGDALSTEAASLNLQGSRVEGQNGAAIRVGSANQAPGDAAITISGGTTLVGSNGNLLEVANGSNATMLVEGSNLVGDVLVEDGSSAKLTLGNQASLTGRLTNVESLALNDGGRWNMVEDSEVAQLAMAGGAVRFGEATQYQRLTLGNLSGSGTFIMDADFSTGETDFLDITGTATGNHSLLVGSSGNEPTQENSLHLVHAAAGDAQFSLLNGPVDLGAFSYSLVQRGNDWFLDGATKTISPGTEAAMALFNTAPTVWYGELSSLRSRMGELRLDERNAGLWARSYGNKYNVSASTGTPYSQVQQGFSLGADTPLPWGDGQWLAGVMAGYSSSDLNLTRGASGEVKSYYLGLYATWLDAQTGYYLDSVVKLNRFDNQAKVSLSDGQRTEGDYDNVGVGASVEFGRHLALNDGYFVEPFGQLSVVGIQGKDYHLDNGLKADGDTTHSVLGKAGATAGRTFKLEGGQWLQPYVRLAYVHEFANNNLVKVNDHRFDNDLSGSRAELGMGVAVSLTERLQLHADFDYSNGKALEQPWGANLGVRYSW
ncbi:autotransporter outer membrane beta-barrel domain-containing protein [Pseudomonas putida]|uniref:autotransporter outer membrane beta-barrel domain-containing protein n=1 Tax=Pseudomonas TaxID=286 RepID=UPI0035248674